MLVARLRPPPVDLNRMPKILGSRVMLLFMHLWLVVVGVPTKDHIANIRLALSSSAVIKRNPKRAHLA